MYFEACAPSSAPLFRLLFPPCYIPISVLDRKQSGITWIDVIWLIFLIGLALLPPVNEIHKQLILLGFGVVQLLEGSLIAWKPGRGRVYAVVFKILLATLLLDHTGEIAINSSYYPIFYLPIVTAAMYYGPVATLLWTALASLAYLGYLIPVREEYELTAEGASMLAIRVLFFFLAAILVNRFVVENRRQMRRYQQLSETLEATNLQLQRAEADKRRSERLAALGQLSAGLAHEIRNPLGVIKGSSEMLSKKVGGSSPLATELTENISAEVNRVNALVARFLDFARPSHLELQSRHIPEIIDRAVEAASHQYPESKVRVDKRYAAIPETMVDAQLLEQVFLNLIVNAYQAMDSTADRLGLLRITAAPEISAGNPGVGVVVEDNGPGIPPEAREEIFNPFFTTKKDGVGLGLAIVAKILDDHRGWIKVEDSSRDGLPGAVFHIFLPGSPAA
jgi:two-component system, NtrC family, sensor histidine kinase HydH